jgi:hypothetical protein
MTDSDVKQPPRCLILAPRTPEFRAVIRALTTAIVRERAVAVTLDTQMEYGSLLSEIALHIPRTIESSDVVIVDITGGDPNVMYELGFAHALKKPVLPLIRKREGDQNIPSDLQGYLYYVYDVEDLDDLIGTVIRWLRRTVGVSLV